MGAHQKIDRLARRCLHGMLGETDPFPPIRRILHFEGFKGPDAIKRKSPAQDEPWHYFAPFDDEDTALLDQISDHYDQLVQALGNEDKVRASFEAAWLAHALVDGLTPAHHFPYEEKLTELRGGAGIETRTNFKEKLVMPGATRLQKVSNNWKVWGPKGLIYSHFVFEWGVALVMAPTSSRLFKPRRADLTELKKYGFMEYYRRKAKEVASLNLYEAYQKTGWTPKLALRIRRQLAPLLVRTVTLAWYAAAVDGTRTKAGKA